MSGGEGSNPSPSTLGEYDWNHSDYTVALLHSILYEEFISLADCSKAVIPLAHKALLSGKRHRGKIPHGF